MKVTVDSDTKQNLKQSHFANYYKAIFNHLPSGVLVVDKEMNFIDINPACLKIFGISKEKIDSLSANLPLHFRLFDFESREIPLQDWPLIRVVNKESFASQKVEVVDRSSGRKVYLSCTGAPQFDNNGDFILGILFIEDISGEVNIGYKLENEIDKKNGYFHKLELYEQKLKGMEELFKAIIDTIPVMVTVYDRNLDYIILNKAVEKITGWTQEDVQQTGIMELAYPNPEYRIKVAHFMESLKPGFSDFVMRSKDGHSIEVSWANVQLPDGRHVGVGIDISGRKKMEHDLVEARDRAEKENQVQYAFIQNISHEVRTPMNSILGFTELLEKSVTGEQEQHFLNAISVSGKQLLRLINDIIDFSRLDKKEMSLTMESISLTVLMEQLKSMIPGLKSTYQKRQLKTYVKIPAGNSKDILLQTDIYRLQQIFTNLISNALKYTDKGKVEVGYQLQNDKNNLLFYVKDTGMGIKPDDHHRVFERFNRFHNNSKKQIRGTGLGLAICKHLVHLLGGKIWFESKPGEGSVFYFTHPRADNKEWVKPSEVKSKDYTNYSVPDLSGKTILIAEDDEFSYKMMYYMLVPTKAKVLHAGNGAKAIRILKSREVHLCFLDLRLPEMSGFQVMNWLRSNNRKMPVIAQTANALPEDKEKTIRAGFDYHAVKPISQNDLYNILNRFL